MTSNNSDVIAELPSIKTCSILSRDDLHSADYAVARCLSVRSSIRLSVCLSHDGILSKRLYTSSNFSHRRVAHTI